MSFWKCSAAIDAAVGIVSCAEAFFDITLFVVVGEVAKLEEERRDRVPVDEPALLRTDRNDAVEERFCKLGVDLRLSSLSDPELGIRLGAVWLW